MEICIMPKRFFIVSVADTGIPYNPLNTPDPDQHKPLRDRVRGGYGIYMVRKLMDQLSYSYVNGQNILRITKEF